MIIEVDTALPKSVLTGFSSSSYFAKCFAKQFGGSSDGEFLEKQDPGTQ